MMNFPVVFTKKKMKEAFISPLAVTREITCRFVFFADGIEDSMDMKILKGLTHHIVKEIFFIPLIRWSKNTWDFLLVLFRL